MRFTALALVAAVAAPAALGAATGLVTDQATLEAVLIDETLETFTFADVAYPYFSTQDFNGFDVTADGESTFPGDFAIVDQQLSLFLDNNNVASFTFDFDNSVTHIGFDVFFAGPSGGQGLIFTFDNGDVLQLDELTVAGYTGNNQFVAIEADTAFNSVTITTGSSIGLDGFDLDNFVAGNIPTPGAVALAGLAGFAATRRRR